MAVPQRTTKVVLALLGIAVLVTAALLIVPRARHWVEARHLGQPTHTHTVGDANAMPRVTLVPDHADTLVVPEDIVHSMGMTVGQVQSALAVEPLQLDGSLFLDTNSMVHVHSRFAGDVVEMGKLIPPPPPAAQQSPGDAEFQRPLQFGDRVQKGQLLTAVWSKDLGEKKSELIESISRLRLSEQKLKRLEELLDKGSVSERNVREAEREVESDVINLARAERTLRSWRLNENEIAAIRAEADQIRERQGQRTLESDANWARVEVRAPISGTIVEKNVAVGDVISSDLDIFKIADLSRMDVLAHAYEEDLPALERLPLDRRQWTILLKADPKAEHLHGRFDRIGNIIDPSQHTALVMGWVDNSSGKLRVGQFVTARIELPTPPNEVAVPVGALVDLDGSSYVFTRSATEPHRYTRRRVFPVRRFENHVAIDCSPHPRAPGDACEVQALHPGEWVVTTGGIQLTAELLALQSAAQVKVSSRGP
jgi:cobalt-zinc-cadmium efflux system membrane fusion protein